MLLAKYTPRQRVHIKLRRCLACLRRWPLAEVKRKGITVLLSSLGEGDGFGDASLMASDGDKA